MTGVDGLQENQEDWEKNPLHDNGLNIVDSTRYMEENNNTRKINYGVYIILHFHLFN